METRYPLLTKTVSSLLLQAGLPIKPIPMPENPVRTAYGLELLNQTTAKVHYFMILM